MIGSIVLLVDILKSLAPHGLIVAQTLDVVADSLRVAGFAVVGAALLGSPFKQAGRLRSGLFLVASGYGAWCLSDVARSIDYRMTHAELVYVASHAVLGVSDLLITVAVATAGIGFTGARRADPPEARLRRFVRLAWSSALLAAGILFATLSSILFVIAFSNMGATAAFTAGLGIVAGGTAVAIATPTIAAVAFLSFARRDHQVGAGSRHDIDGTLAVAGAIFAVGIGLGALGSTVIALAAPINGFDGPSLTAAWLDVGQQLGWGAGTIVASVGFLNSHRKHASTGAESSSARS
jgi:hypothetical protein